MKLSIKQLSDGNWAAFTGKRYYKDSVRPTEREARIARLQEIGREAQDTIDEVDRKLRALGAFDEKDPHGYLA